MDGAKKVVKFGFEDVVVHCDPGSDQFGDPPFDNGLGRLGIFKLVTDGDPLTGP